MFLSHRFLVGVAITTIDWGRWYMLHMAVVLERAILILTFDVAIDVLHEEVFVQCLPFVEELVGLMDGEVGAKQAFV